MLPSEQWFRGLAVCSPMRCAVSSCLNASSTFRYGLLTASEVAHLKLNADWVILSACNTAAADGTPGARGLSGLAKAFFYAGSRALLVSHWPVGSDAAVALTTRMLAAAKTGLTRAKAHRQAMMAMIDTGPARNAHPALWAPFVVVGEGGIRHAQ